MIPGIDATRVELSSDQGGMGGLGEDTFLQLMVAQLQYQNPMSPSDPTAMMEQTAVFTQVEAMRGVLQLQQQLIGFQEVALASSLVGKEVATESPDGNVTGVVEGVRFTDDGPMLTIGGREVPLDATRQVGVVDAPTSAPVTDGVEASPDAAAVAAQPPDSAIAETIEANSSIVTDVDPEPADETADGVTVAPEPLPAAPVAPDPTPGFLATVLAQAAAADEES